MVTMYIRKIMSMLCLISVLLASFASQAEADYPDYLEGNHNRPHIWGRMDTGWFLDKTSIKCEKYEPPCYTLSANILVVNNAYQGNTGVSKVVPMRWFYNYDSRAMYIDRHYGTNDWRYLKPTGSNAESGLPMYAGEAVFYVNYRMRFYGSKQWYDSFLQKNVEGRQALLDLRGAASGLYLLRCLPPSCAQKQGNLPGSSR